MNPLQSTRILPSLSEEEQDHIHKTILGFIGPTDSTTIENLKNGSLKVCSQKINLNQKIHWERPTGAADVQDPLSGNAIFMPSKRKATKQASKWKPAVKNTSTIKRYFMPTSEEDREPSPPDKTPPPTAKQYDNMHDVVDAIDGKTTALLPLVQHRQLILLQIKMIILNKIRNTGQNLPLQLRSTLICQLCMQLFKQDCSQMLDMNYHITMLSPTMIGSKALKTTTTTPQVNRFRSSIGLITS
jgi:hypothetical protein